MQKKHGKPLNDIKKAFKKIVETILFLFISVKFSGEAHNFLSVEKDIPLNSKQKTNQRVQNY